MTTILPDLTEAQLNSLSSQGEAKVYRSLRDHLADDYVVLFQVGRILRREKERARDGETDFLICHPAHGYICVEVKGGGIGFDAATGEWFSIDRRGRRHEISDPVAQALRANYSVRSKLNEHRHWRALSPGNVLRGHAVFFPDIGDANALLRPDLPAALIGTATNLQNPRRWIDSVFAYWGANARDVVPPDRRGVDVIRKVFARSFEVAPLVSSRLVEQEARRSSLWLAGGGSSALRVPRAGRRSRLRGSRVRGGADCARGWPGCRRRRGARSPPRSLRSQGGC